MTAVAEQTGNWLAQFTATPKTSEAWLQELRADAFARFSALGFPTTRNEEWLFTNVAPIARTAFAAPLLAESPVPEFAKGLRIVFVNGHFSEVTGRAPRGATVGR